MNLIRTARVEDLHRILTMYREGFFPGLKELTLERYLAHDLVLVASDAEEVIGFLHAMPMGTVYELHAIFVDSPHRGSGFGRHLLNHLIGQLRELKIQQLWLEVSERNEYAVRLYRSVGGQVTGRRNRYYKDGSDALLFELLIGGLCNS